MAQVKFKYYVINQEGRVVGARGGEGRRGTKSDDVIENKTLGWDM